MSRAYRTSDGKQIRMAYAGGGYISRKYYVSLVESGHVKDAYDNLIANLNNELLIANELITECFERKEEIEIFLYGSTVEKLSTPIEGNSSRNYRFINAKEWNLETIKGIDWKMFMTAFYVFVFSETSFEGGMWKNIKNILLTLGTNKDILYKNLKQTDLENKEETEREFWNVICYLLKEKIEDWCSEETCWLAFEGVSEVKPVFKLSENINYYELEEYFCDIANKVAIKRLVDDNWEEHSDYDVEWMFFYDEYLELESIDEDIKDIIKHYICERYKEIGEHHGIKYYHGAAHWYEKAKEYANDNQKKEIDLKMKPINRKFETEKVYQKIEKILAGLVLLGVVFLVVFVLLFIIALIGRFATLNRISVVGGIVSLIIEGISALMFGLLMKTGKID